MTRNAEVTSKRIASLAGHILAVKAPPRRIMCVMVAGNVFRDLLWSDIRALAASALTQTADKPHVNTTIRKLKRGPRAKPIGKWKRRVNLRARPRKAKT